MPQREMANSLAMVPTAEEMTVAIYQVKNSKSAGILEIVAELLKEDPCV